MKRRDFFKKSSLVTGSVMIPQFLKAFESVDLSNFGNKKLVIIHLKGGNDGLNTIVPYQNDVYYKKRPKLALHKNAVLKITDEIGFNPQLKALQKLYNQGNLTIINSVGYPNPIRSHFRSEDIWQSASDAKTVVNSGWIGRFLDNYGKNPYEALAIGNKLSLALRGELKNGVATTNTSKLYKAIHESNFNAILSYQNSAHLSEHNLGYLYNTMIDAKSSAVYLYEKTKNYKKSSNYPSNSIAKKLNTIAAFINSRVSTKVFYATLSGFDTHAKQVNKQNKLLEQYSEAMLAFVNDLKRNNTFKDTLILTFSEFGRRVKENASQGTDHGTANNLFIIGENLKKAGFYNAMPNLNDLDAIGDIKYTIDFRTVYATILHKWLQVNDSRILNGTFKHLNFI